ncbi:hypothetical protein E1A91_D11G351100v1 [Gossypium mustelinum]|uniref:C2 domain-containing protein n=1 Tax=Gossypium mustelinum TaxID=34275 RepID=A0A5D2SZF4_GOSMU|nr:hypothetical protein E1A91_D11G351100v1 [Gossypium mustelinum]
MKIMECGHLEIDVISVHDLKVDDLSSTMAVYAVVSIDGDHPSRQRTPIGEGRGSNRQWNHTVKFNFDEAAVRRDLLTVAFCLKSDCELGVIEIGTVNVSVKELLYIDHRNVISAVPISLYGITKGMLNFKYKFSEKCNKVVPPPPFTADGAKNFGKNRRKRPTMMYPPLPMMYQMAAMGYLPMYPPHANGNPGWSFWYPPMGDYPYPPPPGSGYPPYGYQQPPFRGHGYGGMRGGDYFEDAHEDFEDYFEDAYQDFADYFAGAHKDFQDYIRRLFVLIILFAILCLFFSCLAFASSFSRI